MDVNIVKYIVGQEHLDLVNSRLSAKSSKTDLLLLRKAGFWFNDKTALSLSNAATKLKYYKDHFPNLYSLVTTESEDSDSEDTALEHTPASKDNKDSEMFDPLIDEILDLRNLLGEIRNICEKYTIVFQDESGNFDEEDSTTEAAENFSDLMTGLLESSDRIPAILKQIPNLNRIVSVSENHDIPLLDIKVEQYSSSLVWSDTNQGYEDFVKDVNIYLPIFQKHLQNIFQLKEVMVMYKIGDRYVDVEKYKETDKVVTGYRCDPVAGIQVCILNKEGEMFFETPPVLFDRNEIPDEDNIA